MPLEGQWERQNTPLRRTSRRENRLVILIGALLAILAVAITALALGIGSGQRPRAGCVQVTAAGNTGGYVLRQCGADAVAFCRQEAGRSDDFAHQALQACRTARIAGFARP